MREKKRSNGFFGFCVLLQIGLLVFGAYIFMIGLKMTSDAALKKKKCTVHTECEIVDISYEEFERREGKFDMVYVPIFRYSFKGVEYNIRSDNVYSTQSFEVGDKTEIYIDPDEPSNVYMPEYSDEVSTSGWIMVIGAGVVVFALLAAFVMSRIFKRLMRPTEETVIEEYFDTNDDCMG